MHVRFENMVAPNLCHCIREGIDRVEEHSPFLHKGHFSVARGSAERDHGWLNSLDPVDATLVGARHGYCFPGFKLVAIVE